MTRVDQNITNSMADVWSVSQIEHISGFHVLYVMGRVTDATLCLAQRSHAQKSHVAHTNKSCRTYEETVTDALLCLL